MIVKKEDYKTASKTFIKAFYDYPMFEWCLPDATRREKGLTAFFEMITTHGVRYGRLETTSPDFDGLLHYLPPDVPSPGVIRWMLCGGLKLYLKWNRAAINRLEVINQIVDQMRHRVVPGPHFYIMQVGVNPAHQGKGHCRYLFNELFSKSESMNVPCYLETMKTVNVGIYEKLGFMLAEELKIPGSPLTLSGMIYPGRRS